MASIHKQTYKTKKGEITQYVIKYRDAYGKQRTKGGYSTLKEARKDLDKFEEIKKYKALMDDGIITQEEFETKKKELLGV